MLHKPRTKSDELIILELLSRRKSFAQKESSHFLNLKKGYEGETQFDALTEKLGCECFILNDLLLQVNNTTFQIDSFIIALGKIYLYEVKNYEGDYYYESDRLFKNPTFEVVNPLHQLERCESLLRQLLLRHGFNFQINASIVFINPTFTLYQAPLNKPIILPTQISQYMKNFHSISTKLTDREIKVADLLLSLNNIDSPYKRLPSYSYDQLQKGMICPNCFSILIFAKNSKCICRKCNYIEPVTKAVLRSVNEFMILFPKERITTNTIHDWCQVVQSKKTIQRILANNFRSVGVRQWTYYE